MMQSPFPPSPSSPSSANTSRSRSSRLGLSLPVFQPVLPFTLPFGSPTNAHASSPLSPNTTYTASSSPTSAEQLQSVVSTAYVAIPSSADLIHMLDVERGSRSMGLPPASRDAVVRAQSVRSPDQTTVAPNSISHPRAITNSALSRENMAQLRNATRTSTSDVRSAAVIVAVNTAQATPELSTPASSSGFHDGIPPRLGSPVDLSPAIPRVGTQRREHRPWTITTNNSGYGPVATEADFPLPIHSDSGPIRDDAYMWPMFGTNVRHSAFEGLAETVSVPRPDGIRRASRPADQDTSFLRMSRVSDSSAFPFGKGDPAGLRMSIATDLSSDYTPSAVAPSSIVRRTTTWAGQIGETVIEEDETADDLASLHPPRKTRRDPPPPLPANVGHSHISETGETMLTPTTDFTQHTSSSEQRVSIASGDTFGNRRRRWSASSPVTEARYESDPTHVHDDRAGCGGSNETKVDTGRGRPRSSPQRIPHRLAPSPPSTNVNGPHNAIRGAATSDQVNSPPSHGTPLGKLREQTYEGSDDEYDARSTSPLSPRLISKVDQVLGRGAYEAGMAIEAEKRILQEALEKSITHSSPPPPRPVHKASASVPSLLVSTNTDHRVISNGTTLARDVGQPVAQSTRKRSGSTESNQSSLQPSIADSVTGLVPAAYTQSPGNQIHPSSDRAQGTPISDRMRASMRRRAEPTDLSTSNDLSTEQRQILLRRVKTLEKRLGEPLREAETGKWVVQPSSVMRGDARGSNSSTASGGSQAAENAGASPLSRSKTIDSAWSREILDQDETQQDRAQRRRQLAKLNRLLGIVVQPHQLDPPTCRPCRSSGSMQMPADGLSFMTLDDLPKMSRRDSDASGDVKDSWTTKIRQSLTRRSQSAKDMNQIGEDQSFMDLRKTSRWMTHKSVKSTPIIREGDGPTAAQAYASGLSQTSSGFADKTEMSEQERAQARKRTQKLSKMFGDVPPHDLYHPAALRARALTPSIIPALGPEIMPVFEIDRSLQCLLFLAEHDPQQLAEIADAIADDVMFDSPLPSLLEVTPVSPPRPYRSSTAPDFEVMPSHSASPSPPSPILQSPHSSHTRPSHATDHTMFSPSRDADPSPTLSQYRFDPNSHAARRKRTGKLSHFFGESIDFDKPPPPLPKSKTRKEVLDAMVSEMWRSVVAENDRGRLRGEEVDRLGSIITSLRNKRSQVHI